MSNNKKKCIGKMQNGNNCIYCSNIKNNANNRFCKRHEYLESYTEEKLNKWRAHLVRRENLAWMGVNYSYSQTRSTLGHVIL